MIVILRLFIYYIIYYYIVCMLSELIKKTNCLKYSIIIFCPNRLQVSNFFLLANSYHIILFFKNGSLYM